MKKYYYTILLQDTGVETYGVFDDAEDRDRAARDHWKHLKAGDTLLWMDLCIPTLEIKSGAYRTEELE